MTGASQCDPEKKFSFSVYLQVNEVTLLIDVLSTFINSPIGRSYVCLGQLWQHQNKFLNT